MRKRKGHTLESKKNILASSINTSTKAQRKKIDKIDKDTSLPTVQFAEVHMYQKGAWHFKGMSCMLCSKIMNDQYVIDNHHYVCEINIFNNKNVGND